MAISTRTNLPKSWSPKNRDEWLRADAAASLSRVLARAVAETGANFQLNDAGRTTADQHALFVANYRDTGKSYANGDRSRKYKGTYWARRPGSVAVAVPGTPSANHEGGVAVDIVPSAIQTYLKGSGGQRAGWDWAEGKRNGEPWHFRYYPEKDQYKAEGWLDHAAVQKAVGAKVDGKIGTGTVKLIKAFQKEHGLDIDGKVGPATKKALGLSGKDEAAPTPGPSEVVGGEVSESAGYEYTYTRAQWDTQGIAEKVHPFETTVEGVYLHYPASGPITMAGESPAQIMKRLRGYRAQHVNGNGWFDIAYNAAADQEGLTYELRGLGNESGGNGGEVSNNHGLAILLMIGDNEKPSAKMIAAVNGLIAQAAAKRGTLVWIKGHQQSPDAKTDCPGVPVMKLLSEGDVFVLDGKPGASAGPDVKVPTNKVDEDGRAGTETIAELQERLGVKADGRAAEDTWMALQKRVKAPYKDGQISRQSHKASSLGNGLVDRTTAWEYTGPNSKGSQAVELLQKLVGVKADGVWGEKTTLALQRAMNADPQFLRS